MSLNNVIREMKNIEQLTCPYCSVVALFSFSLPKAVSKIEIREASCQGCGEVVVQIRKVDYELIPKSPFGGYKTTKNCENWQISWPREQVVCIHDRIPEEIKKDLNKAFTIIDISPDAAAGLTRRALERILRKYVNLKGKDLDSLITASKEVLHPRVFVVLDAVRKTGNFGAHLKEDAHTEELFFVEKEEALLATKAVVDLALEWFVHRTESEEFLQKIESKTERAIKPQSSKK